MIWQRSQGLLVVELELPSGFFYKTKDCKASRRMAKFSTECSARFFVWKLRKGIPAFSAAPRSLELSPINSREEGASTNPHEFKTGHGGVSGFPARKVNRSKIKTKRGEAIAGLSSTKLYKLVTQRSYVSNPSLRKP